MRNRNARPDPHQRQFLCKNARHDARKGPLSRVQPNFQDFGEEELFSRFPRPRSRVAFKHSERCNRVAKAMVATLVGTARGNVIE